MEAQWVADRLRLRTLLVTRSDWTRQDLADALGRSLSWVKKWVKRLRDAPADDDTVLHSQSRARRTPPSSLSPLVVDRILTIRDAPPNNLKRIPGPKAILYYLQQEATTTLVGHRLPRSTRTIWRILRQHQRVLDPPLRTHRPVERPEPLTSWQLDFKDVSSVPADPDGKQQHVVETLDTIDVGTSSLLAAQVRGDFTMATTIEAAVQTVQTYGLPRAITIDRDHRFVGTNTARDCPSPFLRFWLCLGVQVTVCPPRRPDLNAFVERYHRTYQEECLKVEQPADLETATTVTAAFKEHYNYERPHQGLACHNQPPRLAYPLLPARPPTPTVVDPDAWIDAWNGRCFVRKVQRDTSVSIDDRRYYLTKEVIGQYVTLRVKAASRSFVVEYADRIVKRLPIRGTGHGHLAFETFVQQLCNEARLGRGAAHRAMEQLPLPFG
jgi:transposase InsO family protein